MPRYAILLFLLLLVVVLPARPPAPAASAPVRKLHRRVITTPGAPWAVRPRIAVCAASKSTPSWQTLDDTALWTVLIPSLLRTIVGEPFEFTLYLAFDHDDVFWQQHAAGLKFPEQALLSATNNTIIELPAIKYDFYTTATHRIPFNELTAQAYDSGADYIVRVNDDTEFITGGWATLGVSALSRLGNVGVVGPTFAQGKTTILTHDMVHRTHLDIFKFYYPPVFSAWWIDDWITHVYEPDRMRKLPDWHVAHHTTAHGTRYAVQAEESKHLQREIEKGRKTLQKWLTTSSQHTISTVIMAAALNYGPTEFETFLAPLRKVYSGDIVLFVNDDLLPSVMKLCAWYNVTTLAMPTGSRWGITSDRFLGYAKVCALYDWCFATDFRDVFFQADPFSSLKSLPSAPKDLLKAYDLILAEEDAAQTIKSCPYNSGWIKTCYGAAVLKAIGNSPIICSGTIMGTARGFTNLKDAMLQEMERTSKIKGCWADQGHLNYLFHARKLGVPVLVQPRGKGIVNTIGYIPDTLIGDYLNADGLVKNSDGTTSFVVHQYDRFPRLLKAFEEQAARSTDIITEDDLQDQVCDFGFRTRRRDDLKRGIQVRRPSVICAMGDHKTLRTLFAAIVPSIKHNFTLVTLEHDDSVPPRKDMLDASFLQAWYGWNVAYAHPKLFALPIGLNKGRHLANIVKARRNIPPKNGRILVNFKLDRAERQRVWAQSKHWGTLVDRVPYNQSAAATRQDVVGLVTNNEYYNLLSRYSYVVCPQGLGTDTHRVWEALYLGAVPIVLSSAISAVYDGLPVVQFDNWDSFSVESLPNKSMSSFEARGLHLSTWVNRIAGD